MCCIVSHIKCCRRSFIHSLPSSYFFELIWINKICVSRRWILRICLFFFRYFLLFLNKGIFFSSPGKIRRSNDEWLYFFCIFGDAIVKGEVGWRWEYYYLNTGNCWLAKYCIIRRRGVVQEREMRNQFQFNAREISIVFCIFSIHYSVIVPIFFIFYKINSIKNIVYLANDQLLTGWCRMYNVQCIFVPI